MSSIVVRVSYERQWSEPGTLAIQHPSWIVQVMWALKACLWDGVGPKYQSMLIGLQSDFKGTKQRQSYFSTSRILELTVAGLETCAPMSWQWLCQNIYCLIATVTSRTYLLQQLDGMQGDSRIINLRPLLCTGRSPSAAFEADPLTACPPAGTD